MSNYPPDEPVYPATPIYDEAVATTPTTLDQQGGSASKASQAADTVKQTAGDAKEQAAQVASTAKDAGADVAGTTKEAGAQVAGTAKDEAQRVVADTMSQARDLYGQATTELSSQAGKQQDRLTQTIRTFGQDLERIGRGEAVESGPAVELVPKLAGRAHRAAAWLESRSPEDVVYEVRQFAARRPGLFIGLAAVTGVVAARLTKALRAESSGGSARSLTGGSSAGGAGYADGYAGDTYVGGVGETALPTAGPSPSLRDAAGPRPAAGPLPEPVGTEYAGTEYAGTEYVTGTEYATGGQYTGEGHGMPYGAGAVDGLEVTEVEYGTEWAPENEYGTEEAPENEYGTGTERGTTGGLR
ncbi:MAG: hypothetical protein ACTHJL_06650 [Amnibacterium sp.]